MTPRRSILSALPLLLAVLTACSTTSAGEEQDAADTDANAQPAAVSQEPDLPPGAPEAAARLDASPRHGEWVMIGTGGDSIRAWVVYPERSTPAPVVLVVHEIYGLTGWIRSVADQLAADGYIAIAPDLMTAYDVPTDESGDPVREQATRTIRTLDPATYHPQLVAVAEWGMSQPSAADSYGIVGFCWGGSASFRHAIESSSVDAAVVYYGSSPDTETLSRVNAPVLGLYGGDDARVNASVPPADSALKALGKPYEYHMFDGAGHGFLRDQQGRDGANMAATRRAWPMTVAFFREHLGS
ncbi:MAG TPA: dienelactone hydrolase family protein [Longimicrobiales bacterium]|nr:dienelactone hydrolase family protein [Longimicrobiales bacterium]